MILSLLKFLGKGLLKLFSGTVACAALAGTFGGAKKLQQTQNKVVSTILPKNTTPKAYWLRAGLATAVVWVFLYAYTLTVAVPLNLIDKMGRAVYNTSCDTVTEVFDYESKGHANPLPATPCG